MGELSAEENLTVSSILLFSYAWLSGCHHLSWTKQAHARGRDSERRRQERLAVDGNVRGTDVLRLHAYGEEKADRVCVR